MVSNSAIRIAIVEDHRLFREGLRLILAGESEFQIVGEAHDGLQAIDLIDALAPEVVLLDITMPEMDGFQVLEFIRQKSLSTKALILTASRDKAKIIKSISAGAKGYLTKNTSPTSLIKAIKAVHSGQLWVERNLLTWYFNDAIIGDPDPGEPQANNTEDFTPRENDVLHLLAKGLSNKKIADQLYISEKTVKSHLHRIFKKLHVNKRLEAILKTIKLGLV